MNNPPANFHKLKQYFNKFDQDGDGLVNSEQVRNIFTEVGFEDTYIGTINKIIRLLTYEQENKIRFDQLEEFATAKLNEGKFKVWKAKLEVKQAVKEFQKDCFAEENNNQNAAPGAGTGSEISNDKYKDPKSQEGQISIKVGEIPQDSHYLKISLQKQKGNQIKPFIKVTVQRQTPAQAQNLETHFNNLYKNIIEMVQAEEEELIDQIKSVSFITSVNGSTFNLIITTSNKQLIELFELGASFWDESLRENINAKVQLDYKFNFDFTKFVTDGNYNFYDIFVKNNSFHLKWSVWEIFQNLRKIFSTSDQPFYDLAYDSADPFCIFLITLLHCEKFTGKLQFENTVSDKIELKSKIEMMNVLKDLREHIKETQEDTSLNLFGLLQELDGKSNIEVGVKDWRLNVELKVNGIHKLLTEEIVCNNNSD